jgi:sensor c-di-GMP phosphodiesterase-like protein
MAIQLIKRLSVFLSILAFVIFIPGIALATPIEKDSNSSITISQIINTNTESSLFRHTNLTPQQQQQIQAVRQRRNREIEAILNTSQQGELVQYIRAGNDIYQSLEKLNLSPEQQDLINSIQEFTNLKIEGISSRYSRKITE